MSNPLLNLDTTSHLLHKTITDCSVYEPLASSFLDSCQDEVLGGYKEEFEKMLAIIKSSRYNCEKLGYKADIVREQIQSLEMVVDIETITDDDEVLVTLRGQYQRAERLLAQSGKRQEELSNVVRRLKSDVGNLGYITKQGVELSQAQQKIINDLESAKDVVSKELEGKTDQITKLRESLAALTEKMDEAQAAKQVVEDDIAALKVKSNTQKSVIESETQAKEKLEKELRQLRNLGSQKQLETSTKQFNITKMAEEIKATESQIKVQQSEIEKLVKEEEVLKIKTLKVKQEFNEQTKLTRELEAKNEILAADEKLKAEKLQNQKQDLKKLMKLKQVLVRKTRELEEAKAQEENARKTFRDENDRILQAVAEKKKKIEVYKKNLDDLNRERDILMEFLTKTTNESARLSTIIQFQKDQQFSLEMDLSRLRKEISTNTATITTLQAEIDSLNTDSETLSKQAANLLSELKDKELTIFESKRQILQAETKLLHQQTLYESVQADRQALSKELIEKNSKIKVMKRVIKDLGFEIAGVKREVEGKAGEIKVQCMELESIGKETSQYEEANKKIKAKIEVSLNSLKTQTVEVDKLDKFASEAKIEKGRQEKVVETVLLEKEKAAGLVREKNNEIGDLCQRLKDQKLALSYGEAEYKQVLEQIEKIRKDNVSFRIEIAENGNFDEEGLGSLRNEAIKLEKDITHAKSKIKFLEQELENPINIHRWRKLECSDPETYKLVQLLQTLQKKVIAKNEEIAKKEGLIEEKEKLYLHLKTVLTKQAGPEAILQLSELQKASKEKATQLGQMETELNMYKAQVDEYRYDIQVLDKGLADCKRRVMEIYESRSREVPVSAEPAVDTTIPSLANDNDNANPAAII